MEDYEEFEGAITEILDKYAPKKTVVVRGNNKPHMTKELEKAMMTRASLKNIANKTNRQVDIDRNKAQRNRVVKLNRNEKRNFFANIDPITAGKDKNFWKTFKPLFSEKSSNGNQIIILFENNAIRDDETEISNIFNKYFVSITYTLPIEKVVSSLEDQNTSNNIVANAIKKYENHPCIINIKRQSARNKIFEFTSINPKLPLQTSLPSYFLPLEQDYANEMFDLSCKQMKLIRQAARFSELRSFVSLAFLQSDQARARSILQSWQVFTWSTFYTYRKQLVNGSFYSGYMVKADPCQLC